jgi:ABC-2 type transport system permease protein
MKNLKVIKAVARKEIRQLRREPRMLFVIFLFPLFLLVVFGYTINLDVKHIRVAIFDNDKTKESREFVNSIVHSEYFDLVKYLNSYDEAKNCLNTGTAQLVIVFPYDFTKRIYRGEDAPLQFLLDGVNGNTSNIIFNYSNAVANWYSIKFLKEQLGNEILLSKIQAFILEPRFWYNPELKSSRFLVPGLIGIIIVLTAAITVSLSVVREKERNTIEQVYVSPIGSTNFIIGKILPYILFAYINSLLVLWLGNLIFDVPIRGNILFLLFAIGLYIYSALSIGIFVSVIADTQLLAFLLVVVISVLPSMLLSGFIFPIESMPFVIQLITNVTPAKFFLSIIRGILLKGIGFDYLWQNYLYLFFYGTFFFSLAGVAYKKLMEQGK